MKREKENFVRELLTLDMMNDPKERMSIREIARQVSDRFGGNPNSSKIRKEVSELKKKEFAHLEAFMEEKGIDKKKISTVWHKSNGERMDYSIKEDFRQQLTTEDIEGVFAKLTSSYSPTLPTKKDIAELRKQVESGKHLLFIDPADLHIGKLGVDGYNNEVAVKRLREGVSGIVAKSSGYGIDKIVLIIGNDYLHAEGYTNATTKGTRQDVDGFWYNIFDLALKSYVEVINYLVGFADVEVIYNPSNHDYVTGYALAKAIEAYFNGFDNVRFDCSISQRKYFRYGSNLISTTHGDKERWGDLPILMAQECPEGWAYSKHRYVYTHHIHHMTLTKGTTGKDYIGVTVQSLRSPSGDDRWHDDAGYKGSPKAVEGAIHHYDYGRVAVLSHIF